MNHLSASAKSGFVFLPATLNQTIEVIDTRSGKVARTLPVDRPNATRYCSEYNELYATCGQHLVVFDATSLREITNVDLRSGLNEIHHDSTTKRLYVGCLNQDKAGIAVVDITTHAPIGKIDLPAKPYGFAVESHGRRLFANMPTLGQVAVVDRDKMLLTETWQINGAQANYPMALDESTHRLFLGCRKPELLMVVNTDTGAAVALAAIGRDADDVFCDSPHGLIFVSCGGGEVDVIKQRDANTYERVQRVRTGERARTSCFCAPLNELFVAVPEMGEQGAALQVYSVRMPPGPEPRDTAAIRH